MACPCIDRFLPRRKIKHLQVAPQQALSRYMDNPEVEKKIMDLLRIYGHRACRLAGRGTLLRCNDAALPKTAPRAPSRLHAAAGLGYKPPSQRIFRLLACTGSPRRSERKPSHERSQTFDAQGHSRLARGEYVPVV